MKARSKNNTKRRSNGFTKSVRFRRALELSLGKPIKFRATLGRKSMTSWKTTGARLETLELKCLYEWNDPDHLLADHIWIKMDDIENREVVEALLEMETEVTKRITFVGVPYSYAEPFRGRGFHSYHEHYSIGEVEIQETRPILKVETEYVA